MKKIINASIAQTAFTFEEDAYTALSLYITDVRNHFESDASSREIIDDIEARIAELLLETKHTILTTVDVEQVMKVMGNVNSFDSESETTSEKPSQSVGVRTLFRDQDNKVIGGVASGIASFFSIDPLIVRLVFIISIFFGGSGIIVYVLLWVMIPEAKTSSQKLEMRGDSVTIESLRSFTQSEIREVKSRSHIFSKIITFPFIIIGKILRFLLPLTRKIGGVILIATGFFTILGASIVLALIVTNYNAPYVEASFREAVSLWVLTVGAVSAYITFVIPFVFVALLGIRLFRKSYTPGVITGFTLVGIWTLAVIALVASSVQIAGRYHQYIASNEAFIERTVAFELGDFTEIKGTIHNARVTIKEGSTVVTMTGRTSDISSIVATNNDGVLTLARESVRDECFVFCLGNGFVEISVTTPDPSQIDLEGGSLLLEDLEVERLAIIKKGGRVDGELVSTDFELTAEEVYMELDGSTKNAVLSLQDFSTYNSPGFVMQSATVTVTRPSTILLHVTNSLNLIEANRNEHNPVEVIGGAKVTRVREDARDTSRGEFEEETIFTERYSARVDRVDVVFEQKDYTQYRLTTNGLVREGELNTERGYKDDIDATVYVLNWQKPEGEQIHYVRLTNDPTHLFVLDSNREIILGSALTLEE